MLRCQGSNRGNNEPATPRLTNTTLSAFSVLTLRVNQRLFLGLFFTKVPTARKSLRTRVAELVEVSTLSTLWTRFSWRKATAWLNVLDVDIQGCPGVWSHTGVSSRFGMPPPPRVAFGECRERLLRAKGSLRWQPVPPGALPRQVLPRVGTSRSARPGRLTRLACAGLRTEVG